VGKDFKIAHLTGAVWFPQSARKWIERQRLILTDSFAATTAANDQQRAAAEAA